MTGKSNGADRSSAAGSRVLSRVGRAVFGAVLLFMAGEAGLAAQKKAVPDLPEADVDAPVQVDAETLKYDRVSGILEATGNVVIRKGEEELRADRVRGNTNTEEFHAEGNVILKGAAGTSKHESLDYCFKDSSAVLVKSRFVGDPFRGTAEKTERRGNEYILRRARITTCTNDFSESHYAVTARKVSIIPHERLKAYSGTWRFGGVPVLYVPYWYRNLSGSYGFRIYPGYDSRMGYFLLSSYRYRLNPVLKAETHADYREERGLALGQDFKWRDTNGAWKGDLRGYYVDDREPPDGDDDPATSDIDSQRYRVKIRHSTDFTPQDYFLFQGNYLSDEYFIEDFFDEEYRENRQPENYAVYTHRSDGYTFNGLVRGRLNDCFTSVNRLPEASLAVKEQALGASGIYYRSDNAAANLEKVWSVDRTNETDYSAFRADTSHTLSYPGRYAGFLNVVPRASYRGTYYSKTKEDITVIIVDGTNAVEDTVEVERGSELRNYFAVGGEVSFKAFKGWQGGFVSPLRHIVEPYADYTYAPDPSVEADNLYQFDEVDRVAGEHDVRVGARNKWQTKRGNRPYDLADIDVSTLVRLETEEGEDSLESVDFDAELRPADSLALEFDGEIPLADYAAGEFNARMAVKPPEFWMAGVELRYLEGDSTVLGGNMTLMPNSAWAFNVLARHEFEQGRMEEVGGYLQRNYDCMVWRAGTVYLPGYDRADGTEEDAEWRFVVKFWLTAFPETQFDLDET